MWTELPVLTLRIPQRVFSTAKPLGEPHILSLPGLFACFV
jgi:hypothetical protein